MMAYNKIMKAILSEVLIMKKSNKLLLGFGLGTAIAAGCAVVKNLLDKHQDDDLNDIELHKINSNQDESDRGVSPVETHEHNEHHEHHHEDGVPNLKADAMNHGYKPIKY